MAAQEALPELQADLVPDMAERQPVEPQAEPQPVAVQAENIAPVERPVAQHIANAAQPQEAPNAQGEVNIVMVAFFPFNGMIFVVL